MTLLSRFRWWRLWVEVFMGGYWWQIGPNQVWTHYSNVNVWCSAMVKEEARRQALRRPTVSDIWARFDKEWEKEFDRKMAQAGKDFVESLTAKKTPFHYTDSLE